MESASNGLADLIHNLQQKYDAMDHEERIKKNSAGSKLKNQIDSYTKILLNPEPVKDPKADRAAERERELIEKCYRKMGIIESSRNVVSPTSSSTSKTDTMDHEKRIEKGSFQNFFWPFREP